MKNVVQRLLSEAGIAIGGSHPWDIQIHDDRFYSRAIKERNLGIGESYMDGWWDSPRLDEMLTRVLKARLDRRLRLSPSDIMKVLAHFFLNFQTRAKSKEVAIRHYDLSNSLYRVMLGTTMAYSCGYWKKATTLDQAQNDKMDLICRKLMLKPGMRVLDIGCGWGGLAKYAAEHHGVQVVGITISEQQKQYAEKNCQGLPVTISLKDYRDLPRETFDRIVSVGMFEHVGFKNYKHFMKVVFDHLVDGGIFLLHTIGGNLSRVSGDKWLTKYIFPHGMLPSVAQIGKVIESYFVMEDWHNFGAYYDNTLMAWHRNFNDHWEQLKGHFDDRFKRMWNYYLLSCAALFRARNAQLWQIVLSKAGIPGGYIRPDLA